MSRAILPFQYRKETVTTTPQQSNDISKMIGNLSALNQIENKCQKFTITYYKELTCFTCWVIRCIKANRKRISRVKKEVFELLANSEIRLPPILRNLHFYPVLNCKNTDTGIITRDCCLRVYVMGRYPFCYPENLYAVRACILTARHEGFQYVPPRRTRVH